MAGPALDRVRVAGRRLVRAGRPWFARGVCYGPFPVATGPPWFPDEATLRRDLDAIAGAGFNCLRTYHPPTPQMLDGCAERGLSVLAGCPWSWHIDFRAEAGVLPEARCRLAAEAARAAGHPALAGWVVANEIEGTLVRWLGTGFVRDALETLVAAGRAADPEALFLYATYPPTEWLAPDNADLAAFNLFLEDEAALRRYLRRAHHIALDKPLLVTEFGIDWLAHGSRRQARWVERAFTAAAEEGLAGLCWFTWSDAWRDPRGGTVQGWKFGLVDEAGAPHEALQAAVHVLPLLDGYPPLPPHPPAVSVIVCTRNGVALLPDCLRSLLSLDYPSVEVVVVDDGSTDGTSGLVREHFPWVRLVRTAPHGLSAARNAGAAAARGDVLAFLDDDCAADPHWLRWIVHAFETHGWAAAGGPNLPPPSDSRLQRILDALPGTAIHVLLDDRRAEHVPGCNLVVTRAAFAAAGGFDARFTTAGDDVDFCWRLLAAGLTIGYEPGAVVWHRRRSSPWKFLRQQVGYGLAEALLAGPWPERIGPGGAAWKGAIYGPSGAGGVIYRGRFGYTDYPAIYPAAAAPRPPAGIGRTGRLVHRALCLAQPWARALGRLLGGLAAWPAAGHRPAPAAPPRQAGHEWVYWQADGANRDALLEAITRRCAEAGAAVACDTGWSDWDLTVCLPGAHPVRITTVTEYDERPGRVTRLRVEGRTKDASRIEAIASQAAADRGFSLRSPSDGSPRAGHTKSPPPAAGR